MMRLGGGNGHISLIRGRDRCDSRPEHSKEPKKSDRSARRAGLINAEPAAVLAAVGGLSERAAEDLVALQRTGAARAARARARWPGGTAGRKSRVRDVQANVTSPGMR